MGICHQREWFLRPLPRGLTRITTWDSMGQGQDYISERPVAWTPVGDGEAIGMSIFHGQELIKDFVGKSQEPHPGCWHNLEGPGRVVCAILAIEALRNEFQPPSCTDGETTAWVEEVTCWRSHGWWVIELAPPILPYLQVRNPPPLPCSNAKHRTWNTGGEQCWPSCFERVHVSEPMWCLPPEYLWKAKLVS